MLTDDVMHQAIDWHVRLSTLDEQGWTRFTAWLEADPAHAMAYDRVSSEDALRAEALQAEMSRPAPAPLPEPANDRAPAWRRHWRGMAGGAVAAGVAAAVLIGLPRTPADAPQQVAAAGRPRAIALADGSTMTLAPASRAALARQAPRVAVLESGTALFNVRHNAAAPFEVRVGGHVVRDLGTTFEISTVAGRIDIAVAEGKVIVDPGDLAAVLGPGQRLTIAGDTAQRSAVKPALVGAWRSGTLDFSDEPLSDVVVALSRATGTRIELSPALSPRRFTGRVRLSGDAGHDIPYCAALMGVGSRRDGDRWSIVPLGGNR